MARRAAFLVALIAVVLPAEAGWEEARAAAERGDWAAAERELVAVVDELPEWAPAWALLATARLRRGDAGAAAEAMARAVEIEPESSEYRLGLVQALVAADRADEAVALATSLDATGLAAEQHDALVLLLAQALLDLDRAPEAVSLLEARIADAESATLHRALGRSQEQAGAEGAAVAAFARAFALDPEHELPAMRRAISLARRLAADADGPEERARWTARSLELADALTADAPTADNLRLASETALAAGRPEVAVGWLRQATALEPADPRLALHLGRALEEAGQPDGARVELERALALHPPEGLARDLHGRIARLAAADLELDQAARHLELAGDPGRAAEMREIAGLFGEALRERDRLRASLEELDGMRRTLEELGDTQGALALDQRRGAVEAELAAIEANLAQVRAALALP